MKLEDEIEQLEKELESIKRECLSLRKCMDGSDGFCWDYRQGSAKTKKLEQLKKRLQDEL